MSALKISVLFFLELVIQLAIVANSQELVLGFYNDTCPEAENIVNQVTALYIYNDSTLAPALLRLTFHDCFVRGCDASILLEPTNANNATEITAPPNLTLRGFEVIDAIKTKLEEYCPGVVSCADIIQLAGRDAIQTAYGASWVVLTGRRDGTVSLASEALEDLPSPYSNFDALKQKFEAVGLSVKDLVVLSAAHTVGVAHCPSFSGRLYNFSGEGGTDPSLDPNYAKFLKQKCPPNDQLTTVYQDPITPNKFDIGYYVAVDQHEGLFESDAALLDDNETRGYLESQLWTMGWTWLEDFGVSMMKMYKFKVLTGTEGEIRKKCGYVN
uniref:Peroxidase n=1 Tax=Nepenthes mirabilis TaxID=150983 RepID=A0A140GMM6_NEPMI|nr:putative peroxidase 27 [Nepenthes mirabilis]